MTRWFLFALLLLFALMTPLPCLAGDSSGSMPVATGSVTLDFGRAMRAVTGGVSLRPVWDDERGLGLFVQLSGWKLDLPWYQGGADVSANVFSSDGVMLLTNVRVAAKKGAAVPGVLRLASGSVVARAENVRVGPDGSLDVNNLMLALPGGTHASGSFSSGSDTGEVLRLSGRTEHAGQLLSLFADHNGTVSGPCGFEVAVLLPPDDPGSSAGPDATNAASFRVRLAPDNLQVTLGDTRFPVSGAATVRGALAAPMQLDANLKLKNTPVRLKADLTPDKSGWRMAGGTLGLGTTTTATLSGVYGPRGWNAQIESNSLALSEVAALAAAVTGRPLGEWGFGGTCGLKAEMSGTGTGLPHGTAALDFSSVTFMAPAGNYLLDQGEGRFRLQAAQDGQMRAEFDAAAGELLLDTIYLNLAQSPLVSRLALRTFTDTTGRAWDGTLNFSLGGHFSALASGVVQDEAAGIRADGWLEIDNADIGTLYKTFLRDPLSLTSPVIAATNVDGDGRFGMAFSANATGASVAGDMSVRNGIVNATEPAFFASPVELNLPFAYMLGDGPTQMLVDAPPQWGRLRIGGGDSPAGPLHPVDMPVRLVPGTLQTRGTLRLPLPGGSLALRTLNVDEPLSGNFELTTTATLESLDFSRLPAGGIQLRGDLSGAMGQVRLSARELAVEHGVRGTFFGGELTVSGLRMVRPLEDDRRLEAAMAVRDMDLEAVSAALGVGRITGRMDVGVRDFAAAFDQPVGFRLTARSVKTKGVDQDISLKAVNSISVMGTGSGLTGMGVGVFSSFFKQFAYRDIGFACDLNNDVFRVRGLIREGGVEYLIKKPLLFGINVVNGNPDNLISFKDMMERIKRVVAPGGGSPEISEIHTPLPRVMSGQAKTRRFHEQL